MLPEQIEENVSKIIRELPDGVQLVAAAKTRRVDEVEAAIRGGVRNIGYNYVQEAESMQQIISEPVSWHLIGHLQRNKAKKAIELFDVIETVDSIRLAREIDKQCAAAGKSMPVLIEVNSGREANKSGLMPEDVEELIRGICQLEHLKVQGLMTMGPFFSETEKLRPYFRETAQIYEHISRIDLPNVEMKHLSMGMSDSYKVAIEEGATIVRIGTQLFGERDQTSPDSGT
jgi:pyridoxal phosphate enzyme (YggS family)